MEDQSQDALTLRDLLIMKIQALYDVESELIVALPEMAEAATDAELKAGFEKHLEETKDQAKRLEKIFKILEEEPEKMEGSAIRGMVEDAKWLMENVDGENALDASLIAAAQGVEHYEMAGYGTAVQWADILDETEIAELLEETLNEEKMADEKLNDIASTVNEKVESIAEE